MKKGVKLLTIGILSTQLFWGAVSVFAEEVTNQEGTSTSSTGTEESEDTVSISESSTDSSMSSSSEGIDQVRQSTVSSETSIEEVPETESKISYQTHVQSSGWQTVKSNGETSGTVGQAKRLEGIKIKIEDTSLTGSIQYKTHVQSYGWQGYVADGVMSGTQGQAKRLEAIQIQLTGELAEQYDVYYRVHAEKFGWLDWASNGSEAGTTGFAYRLEGIQIQLVKKGEQAPGATNRPLVVFKLPTVSYKSHIEKSGWEAAKVNGQTSGTVGKSRRLEAIKIEVNNSDITGNIEYRTHVQTYGWQGYVKNGQLSGTEGKAKRLEAFNIRLTGELAKHYDVYYRAHAEKFGWLGWAKNDGLSGTSGYGLRLEAVEIKIIKKNTGPATSNSYKKAPADIGNYFTKAPKKVQFKTASTYYTNNALAQGNRIAAGTVIPVSSITIGNNGYPLLITPYGRITANKAIVKETNAGTKTFMDVPYYNQNQLGYWNGCEEFSLYMALAYLGATKGQDIHQVTNAVPKVPSSGNPHLGFNGNPRDSSGFHTIYPRAFTPYAKRYASNSKDISGVNTERFKQELLKGNPIVVWGTTGPIAAPINGGMYYGSVKVLNLHVWLVDGFDGNSFHVSDPIYGKMWVSEARIANSYSPNKMAVAIDK